MNQSPNSGNASLDVKVAEQCARSFNMVFNNALTYDTGHPVTERAIADFMTTLSGTLKVQPMITFVLERDALYLEEERVDTKMSARRLVTTMKNSGIQSLSFEQGATSHEVIAMLRMLKESNHFQSIDQMREYLKRENVVRIRINYVLFKKVTEDESIVSSSAAPPSDPSAPGNAPSTADQGPSLDEKTLRGLTALFSMSELVRDPEHVAKNLVNAASGSDSQNREAVLSYVRRIGEQIDQKEQGTQEISPEQVAESVLALKRDLHQSLEVQKKMGKIIDDEGTLVNEVDRLTYQAIVRIAKDEYKNGSISVKRLATIIRRMLPDIKELKRLLPVLKEGLLEAGMPLADFLELVNALNLELKSDGIADALEQGASEIGLTADDIMQTIRQNPGEAARLIVLASEVRNGTNQDESKLSEMLTEYIESVSSQMALQSGGAQGNEDGARAIGTALNDLEQHLLTKIRAHGLSENLMRLVQEELSKRLPDTSKRLKESWIQEYLANHEDLTAVDLVHLIGGLVESSSEFDQMRSTISTSLQQRGFDGPHVQEICEKVATRLNVRETMAAKLPRGVLNVNNTVFFLQREIGLCKRYGNVFSALMATIVAIRPDTTWRKPSTEESQSLFPTVFSILRSTLRDLDIVGSMGALARNVPFVILSMTDMKGATIVRDRLSGCFQQTPFTLDKVPVQVHLAISVTTYDGAEYADLKAFLTDVKRIHAIEEKRREQQRIDQS